MYYLDIAASEFYLRTQIAESSYHLRVSMACMEFNYTGDLKKYHIDLSAAKKLYEAAYDHALKKYTNKVYHNE